MQLTLSLLVFAATASSALAQAFTLPVTSTWQISTDNGTTWNSGSTTVPQSTSSVRVRMQIGWTPPAPDPFAYVVSAGFDGYVRGVGGAGPADAVTNINMLENGFFAPARAAIQGRRVTSELVKIDPGDNLALGLGTVVVVGNSPATGGVVFGTPLVVFDYRLQLDGSPGERELGLVYSAVPQPMRIATGTDPSGFFTVQPLTQPATLLVVPSPAGLVLAGLSGMWLSRRRRGW
jgi:hypothetical protein